MRAAGVPARECGGERRRFALGPSRASSRPEEEPETAGVKAVFPEAVAREQSL